MMTTDNGRLYDVAIVGLGPVGALMANLLGTRGLSTIALEREAGVYPLPRAAHFDGETMRIFQAAGLAEEIGRVCRPSSKGMHFISGTGKTLLIRRGRDGPGPHGWAANWYIHQPSLEAALRLGLERFPHVDVKLRHDVFAIDDAGGGDHVVLRAEDTARGKIHRIRARYVVGCDGARSLVRRLIEAENEDLGLHQGWLVVDVITRPDRPRVAALPDYTIQWCDPKRPMTVVDIGNNRRRWEIMLMPGDEPHRMTDPEVFWPMIAHWIGPEDASLERSAVYTFHSVIARGWRKGRFLIAGDAAHQTPPFLGQGMCAGMRDAVNLAWKLEAVCRHGADAALLDTYESERRPHVHAFIKLAVDLGAIIQTTDPRVAAERDARFEDGKPQLFDYPQPQLGPGVRADAPPPAGVVFPQPTLPDGRRLDAATQGRFAILTDTATLAATAPAARARWQHHAAVEICDGGTEITDWLTAHGACAVVLRPDGYVLGIARDAGELAALAACLPA